MNKIFTILTFVAVAFVTNIASAEAPTAATSFEDAMSKVEAAKEEQNWADATVYSRQAIDFDRNSQIAHLEYMTATNMAVYYAPGDDLSEEERDEAIEKGYEARHEQLMTMYTAWAEEEPGNAVYQWVLGTLYSGKDYARQEQHMNHAIELDPKMTAAYDTLAMLWEVRGDAIKQLEFRRLAAESAPDDPDPNFYYALTNRQDDYESFRERALAFIDRFPAHNRGAQALYWLAFETKDIEEKTAFYERLREQFPPKDFSWSASGMGALADLYAASDPRKALELTDSIYKMTQEDDPDYYYARAWTDRLALQKSLVEAAALIDGGEYHAAADLLADVKAPKGADPNLLNTMKAQALHGAGHTDEAYAHLLGVASDKPTDLVMAALYEYGAMLDKNTDAIDTEIKEQLVAKAEPLKDYSWKRYDTGEMTSLSDYRGKVVLMNMWYPYCGPCRGENPHLQEVLEKYDDRGFVILNINVHPEEDEFVMPYIRGNGFDFIPVASDMDWAVEEFQARGMPTNVLVDTQGRKVLILPPIAGHAIRTMELQIEFLLPADS